MELTRIRLALLVAGLLVALAARGGVAAPAAPGGPTYEVVRGMVRGAGPRGIDLMTQTARTRMRFPTGSEGSCTIVQATSVQPAAIPAGAPVGVQMAADGTVQAIFWYPAAPAGELLRFNQSAGVQAGSLTSIKSGKVTVGGKSYRTTGSTQYYRDAAADRSALQPQLRVAVGMDTYPAGSLVRFVRILP